MVTLDIAQWRLRCSNTLSESQRRYLWWWHSMSWLWLCLNKPVHVIKMVWNYSHISDGHYFPGFKYALQLLEMYSMVKLDIDTDDLWALSLCILWIFKWLQTKNLKQRKRNERSGRRGVREDTVKTGKLRKGGIYVGPWNFQWKVTKSMN